MAKINVFVYGTLRAGEYNDRGFTSTAEFVVPAKAQGRMWNVNGEHPVYPVVDFAKDGTVVGDLLVNVDTDNWRFESVVAMELGAGYEALDILVYDEEDHVIGSAVAFHYDTARARRMIGVAIPDGDWVAWKEAQR